MSASDSLISGRFELGELLGSGGSASVFDARDLVGDRLVALKILHPQLSGSDAERDAFFAEAVAVARVDHPNVVRVVATGVHEGAGERRAWIAFERAPGGSLGDLVASRGSLRAADALAVTDGIVRGLEAVHAAGIVHRDLSPSNVTVAVANDGGVAADGVRILDFGLADAPGRPALGHDVLRSAASPAAADARPGVLGSVNYLSPEHAAGRPVDERGDLYQVAALLCFMVTGRPPFPRPTVAEVMAAHASAPPPVPSVLVSGIPRAVDRIVVRGMLKQPDARFGSAAEMRAAVEEAAASLVRGGVVTGSTRLLPPGADETATVVTPRAVGSRPTPSTAVSAATASALSSSAPAAPGGRRGSRPRFVATAVALAFVAAATIWLVAASASPGTDAGSSTPTPTPTAATAPPTSVPSATPHRPTTAAVPALAGLGADDAAARLRTAGFAIGATRTRDSPQAAGTVLATEPVAGQRLTLGAVVTLVVASGSNVIPDVSGSSGVAAGSAMTAAGFVAVERAVIDTTVPEGTVIGTEPGAGASTRLGSTVTIVVARGQTTPTPTPTPVVTPTPTPTAQPNP